MGRSRQRPPKGPVISVVSLGVAAALSVLSGCAASSAAGSPRPATVAGFPASAALLTHFLKGTGTAVDYRAGSAISKKALASVAFRTVDNQVQAEILSQLKTGRTRIRLGAAQLPAVAFESGGSDLYWGFAAPRA